MAIFTIGDLHLSLGTAKPMDVFPGWQGYVPRLAANWERLVGPEDTVVLAGDTSWGMNLAQCREDFLFLERLPGKKLLLKGNHDYWWCTMAKMRAYLAQIGCGSIGFLHNNFHLAEGVALCGTRGWMFDQGQPHDEKMMARECTRLRFSLQQAAREAPEAERVAFLHYPPVYPGAEAEQLVRILAEYGVRRCYYGHLHGAAIHYARQGPAGGIDYRLVSADGVQFCPVKI